MLGEELIFKAKSFLRVYKDALDCMHQTVVKGVQHKNNEEFYRKLELSRFQGEISFDADGNIVKGIKTGYFTQLYELSQ
jgi:hypothetical protein